MHALLRLVPIALVAITGCGGSTGSTTPTPGTTGTVDADSEAIAEDGTDTISAESDSETMVTSFLSATATLGVVDTASGFYRPAGCLVVSDGAGSTATDGSATFTLDHCTGPLGLLTITGAVTVTWATKSGVLDLTINAIEPVEFNRATVDTWTASATITASGAARTMDWNATLGGTTARDRAFTRTNQKTVTWTLGASCVTVNGASDGEVATRDLRTTVTSYERCGGCPQSGTIAVTNESTGHEITLAFDGTDEATFTAVDGVKSEIELACTP